MSTPIATLDRANEGQFIYVTFDSEGNTKKAFIVPCELRDKPDFNEEQYRIHKAISKISYYQEGYVWNAMLDGTWISSSEI